MSKSSRYPFIAWFFEDKGHGPMLVKRNGHIVLRFGKLWNKGQQQDAELCALAPEMLHALQTVLLADKYDGALTMGDANLSPAIRHKIEAVVAKAELTQIDR